MGRIRLEQVKPNQLTKLRDINQKLFPILSISDSSDEFSEIFTDEDRGFAFIAYYSDMTVRACDVMFSEHILCFRPELCVASSWTITASSSSSSGPSADTGGQCEG